MPGHGQERPRIDGYTVAGKTGTAYKATDQRRLRRRQRPQEVLRLFVGFVPAEHPRLTVLVSIDEPPGSGEHYGGQVAAPLFMDVAHEALRQPAGPAQSTGDTCTVAPDQP